MQLLTDFWNNWHTPIVIVLILVGGVIARAILIASVKRIVKRVVDGVHEDSSPIAKARVVARTNTIGSVLSNLITWSITITVVSAALSELGIAVGAIIAGAGILGAGVGFGAQSLVRDLISGLFILFEDQFGVGDSVDVGEASGVIEQVGLRVTQIRDVEGTLWYVRNGEIVRVGNKSQGWSRVILDVTLAGDVDVDAAKVAISRATEKVAATRKDNGELIGQAEVWGIQDLTGDQISIRVAQEVTPKHRDEIARVLREEILIALRAAKIPLSTGNTIVINK